MMRQWTINGMTLTAAVYALFPACSAGENRPASAGRTASADEELAHKRRHMVERQIARRGISSKEVLAAMREVPRHRFVRPGDQSEAYEDYPLPIGHGQTISQPFIVALMTEAVALQPHERVLEIGTGSGYQAAVLSKLVREVYTIEIIPALAERAGQVIAELGIRNVHIRTGDGYLGWPEAAPFDAVMLTAAAPELPRPLIAQLAEGGRIVAPVDDTRDQRLMLYRKEKGEITSRELAPVRFVPMTGKARGG